MDKKIYYIYLDQIYVSVIMALCESQLGSMMQLQDSREGTSSPSKKTKVESNGDIYGLDKGWCLQKVYFFSFFIDLFIYSGFH